MSVKVARNYWYRVLDHYLDILHAKFLHVPLTPVAQHHILVEFERAVAESRKKETHPVWHVPLIVRFDLQKNSFFVEPTNPNDVEIT